MRGRGEDAPDGVHEVGARAEGEEEREERHDDHRHGENTGAN